MRYLIKQKLFTIASKFTIFDENEQAKYFIEGKILSIGKKLKMFNIEGKEELYIEQQLFNILPKYKIYRNSEVIATIKRRFTILVYKFDIESIYGNLSLEGDIFRHEFKIMKDNIVIATVSKKWFTFSDTYGVEIHDDEDQSLILALLIIVDQIMESENNRSND